MSKIKFNLTPQEHIKEIKECGEKFTGSQYYCLYKEDIDKLIPYIEEKDKEIERLNNIINEYKNANEYHQNIIHELETMKQPNQLHSENVRLRAENNRLNNIINEFEKWLKAHLDEEFYWFKMYDKLQGLKGDSSNE